MHWVEDHLVAGAGRGAAHQAAVVTQQRPALARGAEGPQVVQVLRAVPAAEQI